MTLKEKIVELFDYRKFPVLLEETGGLQEEIDDLVGELIELQENIYYLDAYLESNWNLDKKIISEKWKDIYNSKLFTSFDKREKIESCKEIFRYQTHEMELRESKLPIQLDMEFFYYYKSCDVKLLRRLIYKRYPILEKKYRIEDWLFFDLITELNDDIEDVFEDQQFYNGNSFNISVLYKGKEITHKTFKDFILDVVSRSERKAFVDDNYKRVHKWTLEYANNTLDLLDQNMQKIEIDKLKENKLFQVLQTV